MSKTKTKYSCQNCGYTTPKWEGMCRGCSDWNTLVEELVVDTKKQRDWTVSSQSNKSSAPKIINLSEDIIENKFFKLDTGSEELNRVLGGGVISGSYTLVGGAPGIGKSTLLMQMSGGLAKNKYKVLYISGEESMLQTSLRAQRLGLRSKNISVAAESELDTIINLAKTKKPDVLIIDSIQTIYFSELSSAPGTVSQVRECAHRLMAVAKNLNTSIFIVGHITKDGTLAGPKVLEHIVDTVLSFEGDNTYQFRLLRSLKNRFGPTNELGVFQMSAEGLEEVKNPSQFFLEERGEDTIGSSVFATMEGTRPLLCETQSLVSPTRMTIPRRTTVGLDVNRVHLLIAVLDKNLKLNLTSNDVFVNIVGGLKIQEPASDLSVAASLISSCKQKKIHPSTCFFGEVGLTGEVRATSFAEKRIKEGEKLGFKNWVIPFSNKKHLTHLKSFKNSKVYWVKHINEIEKILSELEKNK